LIVNKQIVPSTGGNYFTTSILCWEQIKDLCKRWY